MVLNKGYHVGFGAAYIAYISRNNTREVTSDCSQPFALQTGSSKRFIVSRIHQNSRNDVMIMMVRYVT
jgi:hypothetical protein